MNRPAPDFGDSARTLMTIAETRISEAIELARTAVRGLSATRGAIGESQRSLSIAITNADTAALWLAKAISELELKPLDQGNPQ